MSRIDDAADLVGEIEPIIAQELAEINGLIISKNFTAIELEKREQEIQQQIEKAKQTREEFDISRYELVNDKGFRYEFEDRIKKSRIKPHESLLFTHSFLKKENGCWCKMISDSAAIIHITKDIRDKLNVYYKKKNLGKSGTELQMLISSNEDLEIDFDGDSSYSNKTRVFFKPAGEWIHFIIDYMMSRESEEKENVFYVHIKSSDFDRVGKGRYWLLVYEMEFKGFFETKTYEYILSDEDGNNVFCLNDDEKKSLFQKIKNVKSPVELDLDMFDYVKMRIEDVVENRKEEITSESMSKNSIKIGSRIQAIKNLSEMRICNLKKELISASDKNKEKFVRAIERESKKAEDKISILEEKMKFVGTYALDSVCVVDVV